MAYDIGTARGVIEMEYNGRGIDQAQDDLKGMESSGRTSAKELSGVGTAAGAAGLAVAAGLGLAVKSAADFEQRLSAVKAVSGATGSEMDAIRDKAMQLGADTAFSASEAASAMEELVKAGLSVDDVLNGAADATVALAAAGEVSMPEAATIASNAMNQFNLTAKDMVGVVDNIAGAANASAIDVGDFGQSLAQVGAVANLSGVSFEDTATAIALLGNAGIKGSDAGTSLKTMLSNLQPTTKKQIELFKELGIVTKDGSNRFFDAQGNMKSMAQVAGVLGGATQNMTKQQKMMALETMFGSDAIRAAAIIADEGAGGFRRMSAAMGETSAAEVAKTRMDNFKGTLEEFKGSMETAAISIGSVFLPMLSKLAQYLTKAANWFNSLSSTQQKWIAIAIASVGGILLVVAGIIKFIIVLGKVKAALILLRGTMIATWLAAAAPILPFIAAIAAVIAIIVLLWQKNQTFRTAVIAAWNAIKAAAAAVAAWFMGSFVPAVLAVWNAIKAGATAVWGIITGVIRGAINIIKAVIIGGMNIIRGIWSTYWNLFGPIIKAVWNLIVAVIRLAWTIIKGVVIIGINLVKSAVTSGFNAVRSVVSSVMNAIRAVIASVWGYIGPYVMGVVNNVKSAVTSAWNAVKSATTTAWNAVKNAVSDAVDGIMDIVNGIQDRITGFFSGAASWLTGAGADIINGLISGIQSKISAVTDVINSITDRVARFLPGSPVEEGPLKVLNRGYAGRQIVEMIVGGINDMAGPLASALNDVVEPAVPSGFARPGGPLARPTRGGRGSGDRSRLRMIDGELRLSRDGRAFISGVAAEEVEDDGDYDDTLRRMGGGGD